MLSKSSKKSIAGNIFSDCLDGFKKITSEYLKGNPITSWEDFIEYVGPDFEFALDKCKFVYKSFPILKNTPFYAEIYERLNTWTPQEIFQLYGQPCNLPAYFFFKEARFQTEEEAERSNKLAMDILNELLAEEKG